MLEWILLRWWSVFWLIVSLLLLLFILYLRGTFHIKLKYRMRDVPSLEESHFALAMMGVSSSIISQGSPTSFWFEIDKIYAARLEAIRRAGHTIHFESFYFTPGRRADEFSDALVERALAGVEIQLIVDSLGAKPMPKEYWNRLRTAGVDIRFFHEFTWSSPLTYNIRTHRKLLLIDGEIAFIGGMGVSDLWDGTPEKGETAEWLDFEVCFHGAIVATLEGIFTQHLIYVGGVATLSPKVFNPSLSGGSIILVTPRNAPSSSSSIYALFYTSVLAAKERIWLASPYFLPDANSRRALLTAKKNGIDVRIVTMGPHCDKKMIYYAARERYRELVAAGIELYEYQPSMMHAKVLLIDDTFVSTGSANFDPRSLFHNEELHLSLAEPKLAKFVEQFFTFAFSNSRRIEMKMWKKRALWQRFLGQLALFFRWQL